MLKMFHWRILDMTNSWYDTLPLIDMSNTIIQIRMETISVVVWSKPIIIIHITNTGWSTVNVSNVVKQLTWTISFYQIVITFSISPWANLRLVEWNLHISKYTCDIQILLLLLLLNCEYVLISIWQNIILGLIIWIEGERERELRREWIEKYYAIFLIIHHKSSYIHTYIHT